MARQKIYQTEEEKRQAQRLAVEKYRSNPEVRQRLQQIDREYKKFRYDNDPEYREHKLERAKHYKLLAKERKAAEKAKSDAQT